MSGPQHQYPTGEGNAGINAETGTMFAAGRTGREANPNRGGVHEAHEPQEQEM